jgi:hypothetical protein
MYQRLLPHTLAFKSLSRSICCSRNQRRPLWCFGSGNNFFLRQSCKVEPLTPVRSAAWANEIGASSGGVVTVSSPRLCLRLASSARCRYSELFAYSFLRFSESRCLFFACQRLKLDSFCFMINVMIRRFHTIFMNTRRMHRAFLLPRSWPVRCGEVD